MPPRTIPRQDPIPINITISGTGGCGKSSITLRLVRSQWTSSYDPTIEDSYSVTRIIDGQPYILSLTDTAGQEEYRSMWAASNLQSDAFLLVYDITSLASLEELEFFNDLVDIETEQREEKNLAYDKERRRIEEKERAKSKIRRAADMGMGSEKALPPTPANRPKMLPRPVKILAGNKCDLSANRQVPAAIGLDWARKRNCGFMETSARNVVNIEETFALIVRRVMEARRIAELATIKGLDYAEEEAMLGNYDRSGYDRFGRKISPGGEGGVRVGEQMKVNTTKPLSPLPAGGTEKSFMCDDGREERDGKWWDLRTWRSFRCF